MQQTSIQELIEFMKTKRYNTDGVTLCENKATSLLPTEQQYVQQYAEGFAEWISNNQFTMYNYKWTSTKIHYSGCDYTTSELYTKSLTV